MLMEETDPEVSIYGLRRKDSDNLLIENQVKQAKMHSIKVLKVEQGLHRASVMSTQSNGTQKLTEGNEASIRGSLHVSCTHSSVNKVPLQEKEIYVPEVDSRPNYPMLVASRKSLYSAKGLVQ